MSIFKYKQKDQCQVYKSAGKWYWRAIASNGRIVGASSQGYNNKSDCIDNLRRYYPEAEIIFIDC